MKVKLPPDIDDACVALCGALNDTPGVTTVGSCCGHGVSPYEIFFEVRSLSDLARVAFCVDACHSGAKGWQIIARTDCAMRPVFFVLRGPAGDYAGAAKVTESLLSPDIETGARPSERSTSR